MGCEGVRRPVATLLRPTPFCGIPRAHDGGRGAADCISSLQKTPAMAVPKRKVSPSRRGMRRAHHALAPNSYIEDKDTGELRRPHHVDLKTGMYKGRQVLTPKED